MNDAREDMLNRVEKLSEDLVELGLLVVADSEAAEPAFEDPGSSPYIGGYLGSIGAILRQVRDAVKSLV